MFSSSLDVGYWTLGVFQYCPLTPERAGYTNRQNCGDTGTSVTVFVAPICDTKFASSFQLTKSIEL